jgi:hypothetical protein
MTCPLCQYTFTEAEAEKACRACTLIGQCGMLKCPRCGYDIPKEPWLARAIRRWLSRPKA